jgi:translation elongation factor EF-Tu-like GTPase
MAWFRRKDDDMDPQRLLAEAHAQTPVEPIPMTASGFRMTVHDVFSISGRGTVVTGRIEAGTICVDATVRLSRSDGTVRDLQVAGVEAFRKKLESASVGENVGLLLKQISKADVAAGDVLSA